MSPSSGLAALDARKPSRPPEGAAIDRASSPVNIA